MRAEQAAPASRRPASRSALVLAVLALAISIYLTVEHYTASLTLACPENATFNCAKVTTSDWSMLFGVPVAVLGVVYFAVMTLLLLPVAWRVPQLDVPRVVGAIGGVGMVVYLIWAELFRVDSICVWCTAVHACTILLFVAVLWHVAALRPGPAVEDPEDPEDIADITDAAAADPSGQPQRWL